MANKSFTERRRAVRMDQLVAELRAHWQELPDKRNRVIHQSMGDVAMSAFALFALKYPSLLQFDTQTQVERDNLQQLFGIEQVCSDTQMRHLLDGIDPHHFADQLGSYWEYLSRLGITQEYRYRQRYHIVSIDGVEHFRSSRIKCSGCLERTSGGQTSYSHSMLCAALMHPDQRELSTGGSILRNEGVKHSGIRSFDCHPLS